MLCAIGMGLQHHFCRKGIFTINMIGIKRQPIMVYKRLVEPASGFVDLYETDF